MPNFLIGLLREYEGELPCLFNRLGAFPLIFGIRRLQLSCGCLNLLFAQHFSERFLTLGAVEESNFQLHPLSRLVRASSHRPLLLW